jgi:hypothetical protein
LKCATQFELVVVWNLLIRLPRELQADYDQMQALMPRIFHLCPPSGGAVRMECHRFSPYYFRPGFVAERRPAKWYRGLFPEDQFDLDKVAYYFDVKWHDLLDDPHYDGMLGVLKQWMNRWREPKVPRLTMMPTDDGGLAIEDTRGAEPVTFRLTPEEAMLYRTLDDIATPNKIRTQLLAGIADDLDQEEIRRRLRVFVDQGLAIEENDHFLALAIAPAETCAQHDRQTQMPGFRWVRPSQDGASARPGRRWLPVVKVSSGAE